MIRVQNKRARSCGYLTVVPDFYKDFSSDFERSDPSNSSSPKRGIERILVRILVKDFRSQLLAHSS